MLPSNKRDDSMPIYQLPRTAEQNELVKLIIACQDDNIEHAKAILAQLKHIKDGQPVRYDYPNCGDYKVALQVACTRNQSEIVGKILALNEILYMDIFYTSCLIAIKNGCR